MKKNLEKTILLAILVIVFIYSAKNTFSKNYNVPIDNMNHLAIFNDSTGKRIFLESAFCNESDTFYNLRSNNYEIILWKILRFKNISSKDIQINFNAIRNRQYFLSNFLEVGPVLKVNFKLPDNYSKNLTLNIQKSGIVYDTINFKNNKGYYFRSAKFGIGDVGKRSNLLFDFGRESREVFFLFLNDKKQDYLLVFYPNNNQKINVNEIKRLLR